MQPLFDTLQQTVEATYSVDLELEFRLGRFVKRRGSERFDPDVGKERWHAIWTALSAYRQWDCIVSETCTDYYMPNGDRVTWHDDGSWSCLHKQRCHDVNINTQGTFDVRVSLSTEVQKPAVCGAQGNKFSREKHRLSFRHGMWSIDITRVVSTESTDSDNAETFEVEVELIHKPALDEYPLKYLLHNGLLLIQDLFNLFSND